MNSPSLVINPDETSRSYSASLSTNSPSPSTNFKINESNNIPGNPDVTKKFNNKYSFIKKNTPLNSWRNTLWTIALWLRFLWPSDIRYLLIPLANLWITRPIEVSFALLCTSQQADRTLSLLLVYVQGRGEHDAVWCGFWPKPNRKPQLRFFEI